MKTHNINQEILLVTTTTFSKRQWCEKDVRDNSYNLSPTEQLEEACWNGLLDELLPETIVKSASGKKLYLWQIRHGKSFLDIELSEYPVSIENHFSIDPYSFMPVIFYN
jgi:hypothetical protein